MAVTANPYHDITKEFLCKVHDGWVSKLERAQNGNRLPCCKACKAKIDEKRAVATQINNSRIKGMAISNA